MDTEDQNDELEEEGGEIMDVYQDVPRKKREKPRPSKKKRWNTDDTACFFKYFEIRSLG